MNTNNILSADMLDILFDNRNKEYGAYELRRSYSKRIGKALLLTGALITIVMLGSVFASSFHTKEKASLDDHLVVIRELPIVPDKPPVVIPPKQVQPVQTRTEIFTEPKIVDKQDIQAPPENTDLDNAAISDVKLDGLDATGIATPAEMNKGTGVIEDQKVVEPIIFTRVEVEAMYDGDWAKFLNRNLNAQVPSDNGAPEGSYRVLVQFVVDIDGSVSDIKPLTNMGYGMEQEAMRVIKKSLKWKAAFQNSRNVKAYRTQPVTFQVISE